MSSTSPRVSVVGVPVWWAMLYALALPPLAGRSSCAADRPPPSSSTSTDHPTDNSVPSGENAFSDSFFQCYKDSKDSAVSCMEQSAKSGLSSFFSKENLQFSEGLSLVQESNQTVKDGESREVPLCFNPYAYDFSQSKSIIDTAAAYLSARAIRWDMSSLYPGLVMRVGPTLTGAGVLEFVMEPRKFYSDRALGPSRVVLKQVIIPFLLGLKVSVASLVPLLLFALVFLAKKALLLTQLSALVSGVLGFGSMGYFHHHHGHGFDGGFGPGPGLGPGLGAAGIGEGPVIPVRSSHAFAGAPRPAQDEPSILHFGVPLHQQAHHPHHLFRGVNYDIRDEKRSSSGRGFRWEEQNVDEKLERRRGIFSLG